MSSTFWAVVLLTALLVLYCGPSQKERFKRSDVAEGGIEAGTPMEVGKGGGFTILTDAFDKKGESVASSVFLRGEGDGEQSHCQEAAERAADGPGALKS
ncbi:hypothetical protein EYF80_019310 [Liparis tanakae]|uniref:Uncharacterized protein n=1 Tax=Liparis tanakae TaxID=230148 RepID=A0A4Z2HZP0_9TELE|nr:hypothetical protein EYF80_019310 [Liparis tanakae]